MKRDPGKLATRDYDLLVVGGGIHGAFIAWDAALRGLEVALIEQGDFGHATSANSLKIVHGGLRYLRDGDLGLVRRMSRERLALLRIAPHLVRPLPCLMPTYQSLGTSRALMAVALRLNDLIGHDRNRHGDLARHLPASRIMTRNEALSLAPGLRREGLTGGALWYDAQMYSPERLTLAVVRAAAGSGADVANYLRADGLCLRGGRVVGVQAHDLFADTTFALRARLVVNAAGPWAGALLGPLAALKGLPFRLSTAMNLVTRQLVAATAVGVPSVPAVTAWGRGKSRMLFITPWRGYSLIGTTHEPYDGHPDDDTIRAEELERFIDEVNRAYPAAALSRHDLLAVQRGLLPAEDTGRAERVKLLRRGYVYDHESEEGVAGRITAVGVKYPTARHVAEQVVDRALARLARPPRRCSTHETPVFGGRIERVDQFIAQEGRRRPAGLAPEVVGQLIHSYGSEYGRVVAYAGERGCLRAPLGPGAQAIGAEVVHAVREEMAHHLADVVLRRVGVGSHAPMEVGSLRRCAEIMARELGWSEGRREQELAHVRGSFDGVNDTLAAREVAVGAQPVM